MSNKKQDSNKKNNVLSPLSYKRGEAERPLSSILIANRGEIASRIIRTCKKMGIRSIAVFSDADKDALFVEEADMAVHIGESSPNASYLVLDKIIDTAKKTGADAIHPGYGFLSENVNFAKRCEEEGIIFVGPHPKAIAAMGSKSNAKELMIKHHVPVVPGYQGKAQDITTLTNAAKEIGFPILLKATAGGGGKGMRIVHQEKDVKSAIQSAKRESLNAFGDDELIVEKYISSGRHLEFQIFGDKHGNAIHILERECSIQRRYQKVIEESPSPIMDEALRTKMGKAAVNAAKALKYDNAGTVEFIYDDTSGDFYFLEVNTRLQVEHPVTEEVTGLDLVQMQIESAQGLPLSIKQEDIKGKGYAIECRLYAEDASNDFLPVTGTIEKFEVPDVDGLRVETAIKSGSEISIFYDPMIAKLIVWDESRQTAHRKMKYVLRNMVCLGMTTNQDFLLQLLEHPDFLKGEYNTHFIANKMDLSTLGKISEASLHHTLIATTLSTWKEREGNRKTLRSIPSGWRNNFYQPQKETYIINEVEKDLSYRHVKGKFSFTIGEQNYYAHFIANEKGRLIVEIDGIRHAFHIANKKNNFFVHHQQSGSISLVLKDRFPSKEAKKVKGGYETPMPSQIIEILVKEGQKVSSGDSLVVLSSMKMESTIEASEDGIVEEIYAEVGKNIEAGFLLLKIKEEES
ncbi:MAG: acetyl-CoA carboxylase biotin carboxylase subunit [Maribacter sp.]|jgi:acetyl-CoA carboxylase biotin carboxylase subunit